MARRKKPDAAEFLEKGISFFNSLNQTINSAAELFSIFAGPKYRDSKRNTVNGVNRDINDEAKVKDSAYRFMKLQPGCGVDAVRSKFRAMVKDKRPDLDEGDNKTKWFMALQVARETLLKYEK